ncbi:TOMM precursor leader peptide-binding protein [Streptomyces sp. NPDC007264]|uniref:TOMM precursor leader peptide-binding protein n=1 Tax=Streptomyces sp. NPDC007264 TaxID=3364777 RepID=UPI0036D9D5BB
MDEAYEAIARTRPRIRRDVLFTETPRGVLFHNADGGFHLEGRTAYRFAALMVPFLTGDHRVAEVCASLGESQRAMVTRLVSALYERGFARDVPVRDEAAQSPAEPVARRFAAQIAYVDHYIDGAEERFERFRRTRVAVVGEDLVARWCALSLIRNGIARVGVSPGLDAPENALSEVRAEAAELTGQDCPAELAVLGTADEARLLEWADLEGFDVVVTTGGGPGPRQLVHLLRTGVPEGRTLLPFSVFGDSAVVGPAMTSGTTGCWYCAALRLGANGDPGTAADLWSAVALGTPVRGARRPGRPLSAMLGNLLGYEVFRLVTGALPAETEGQVVLQDLDSLDTTTEPLLPHPCCPHCSAADAEEPWPDGARELPEAPRAAAAGQPVEAQAEAEELVGRLNARMDLVRPFTGVFRRFTDEPWTQTPLKIGSLSLSLGGTVRREIAAFDVHTVAGARLRALDTAAAVYAEHVVPPRGLLTGAALAEARDRLPSVAPGALSTASGTAPGTDRVGHWTVAVSLLTKEEALVPAAAVRTFGEHNTERLCVPTSGGTGVGGTPAEAAAAGLLSALAYDSLLRALRRTGPVSLVAPERLSADAELTFLAASARNLGLDLELLDLGEAGRSGAHVLLARAQDPERGGWAWSVGGALGRRAAASVAVRDLLGSVQLRRDPECAGAVDTGDPLLADLEPAALAVTAEDAPRPDATWEDLLRRLREAGRDALAVRTGSADLRAGGLSVVRVLLAGGGADAD